MTKVTIDENTAAALATLKGQEFELCDEEGNVVGWYAPARSKPTLQELLESCPTSEEELQRRVREEGDSGRTWTEIRRDLEAR